LLKNFRISPRYEERMKRVRGLFHHLSNLFKMQIFRAPRNKVRNRSFFCSNRSNIARPACSTWNLGCSNAILTKRGSTFVPAFSLLGKLSWAQPQLYRIYLNVDDELKIVDPSMAAAPIQQETHSRVSNRAAAAAAAAPAPMSTLSASG
jgi:hypothetical protein